MKSQQLAYTNGKTNFLGYLAWDDTRQGTRPGIIVFPEAFGLGDHGVSERIVWLKRVMLLLPRICMVKAPSTKTLAPSAPSFRRFTPIERNGVPWQQQRSMHSLHTWPKYTGADPQKLNVNGGAIALGHPLGASGGKLMATLVHALRTRMKRYGLQTMCEGGGIANVTIIEALY